MTRKMKDEMISYEVAKLAYESGFENDNFFTTQSLLLKWLREVKKINIEIWVNEETYTREDDIYHWEASVYKMGDEYLKITDEVINDETPEKTLERALLFSLKYLKNETT